jgi:hypothetical protein
MKNFSQDRRYSGRGIKAGSSDEGILMNQVRCSAKGLCDYGNEPAGSTKRVELSECLNDCYVLKRDYV